MKALGLFAIVTVALAAVGCRAVIILANGSDKTTAMQAANKTLEDVGSPTVSAAVSAPGSSSTSTATQVKEHAMAATLPVATPATATQTPTVPAPTPAR